VIAAVLAVLLAMPGRVGYFLLGAVCVATLATYVTGVRIESAAGDVTRR
jgi:hypothetical protein